MIRSRAAIGVDLLTIAVILSVAVAAAGLTWRLLGVSGQPVRAVQVDAAPPAPPIDVAAIVRSAPFGSAAQGPATAVAADLTLRAILFARPAPASTALISAGGAPAILVHVGDAVPGGGGVVDGIAIDHVLIRAPSGMQTLAFPKPGAASEPATGAPAPQPFVGLPTPAAPVAIPSAPLLLPPPPGGGAPAAFLDSMGASAADGGYRIGPNASPAMRQAGLQPGDLIERVNGTAVGNADRDRALFAAAAAGGALRVDLLRGGRRIAISVPGR